MTHDPTTPEAQPCIVSDAMTCWRRPDGTPARPEYGGIVQAKDWQAFAARAAELADAYETLDGPGHDACDECGNEEDEEDEEDDAYRRRKAEDESTTGAIVGTLFGQYADRYGMPALRDYHVRLMGALLPVLERVSADPAAATELLQAMNDAATRLREPA